MNEEKTLTSLRHKMQFRLACLFDILGFSLAIISDLALLPFAGIALIFGKLTRRFNISLNPKPEKIKIGKIAVLLLHGAGFCQVQWSFARLFLVSSKIGSVYSLNYGEGLPFNPFGNGIESMLAEKNFESS
jgi:hypothetical protein